MSVTTGSYYNRYYPQYFTHDYHSIRSMYPSHGSDMIPAYRNSFYHYTLNRQLDGIRNDRLLQNDAYRHNIGRLEDHRIFVQPQLVKCSDESAKGEWDVYHKMYTNRSLVPNQQQVDREYYRGLRDNVRQFRVEREVDDILLRY